MKRIPRTLWIAVGMFIIFASSVAAIDFNPMHWIGQGAQGVVNAIVSAGFAALILWLGKGKWDAAMLKGAIYGIKEEIDMFRKATGQASPGGTKIVADEWGSIAGKTITNVLEVLRGLNPKWMPHIQ